jgi:hypothetical protein
MGPVVPAIGAGVLWGIILRVEEPAVMERLVRNFSTNLGV